MRVECSSLSAQCLPFSRLFGFSIQRALFIELVFTSVVIFLTVVGWGSSLGELVLIGDKQLVFRPIWGLYLILVRFAYFARFFGN